MGEKKKDGAGTHKALYRKYRSKSLDEIVGQEHITKTLASAIKQGRISHAYLFTGPRGTGKTSIARILAHELNRLPYSDESTHLDIIEIDAASNRRIDDIRDLRDKVHIAPLSARYKVYIIDEVHMLTTESFNALLKTLEEPPEHVIFILATTEVHKLPATIISRTQRHSFKFISQEKVTEHLKFIAKKEGIQIEDAALELLAKHGGGSFRDSISLLDQISGGESLVDTQLVELLLGLAPSDSLIELLDAATSGDTARILELVEIISESGVTPAAIALQLSNSIKEKLSSGENQPRYIDLMKELLAIQSSQYPKLKLETVLLSASPRRAAPEKSTQPSDVITAKTPEQPKQTNPEPESEFTKSTASSPVKNLKEEPAKLSSYKEDSEIPAPKESKAKNVTSTDFSIENDWPKVLDIVKQKNNPLYTVLRLATPIIENDALLLVFNFPFHQKKVEEVKYKAVIAEVLAEVGTSISFSSLVDKSRAKPQNSATLSQPQPAADPAHASLISNIQDIMGGGDIVNT